MIQEDQEDYVSFETSKLLKEKGFDWYTYAYYEDEDNPNISFHASKAINWNKTEFISKPTLQKARKWIRLTHNIHIRIIEDVSGTVYEWQIYKDGICQKRSFVEDTYEEALETAIKYCLENLI